MSEIEGTLKGVLNCVEILVKNIRRRRDVIIEAIDGKKCICSDQISLLLNTFVDQILDDNNNTSEELLAQILSGEPHKALTGVISSLESVQQELRLRIKSLELELKKETENKQRIKKHCSWIMTKTQENGDNFKTQIQELNETIENLKKSESELKSQISELNNRSLEPSINHIEKEEPDIDVVGPIVNVVSGFCNDSDKESVVEEEDTEIQKLRNRCLASNLSVSLQKMKAYNLLPNGSVVGGHTHSCKGSFKCHLCPKKFSMFKGLRCHMTFKHKIKSEKPLKTSHN